jgi:hypothetical protein
MNFKDYITENLDTKHTSYNNVKSNKQKQMNLLYQGWGSYKNRKGQYFKWDEKKQNFIETSKENRHEKSFDNKDLAKKTDKKVSYDNLPILPHMVASIVYDKHTNIPDEKDKEIFADRVDELCKSAYKNNQEWFNKVVNSKGDIGRDLMYKQAERLLDQWNGMKM